VSDEGRDQAPPDRVRGGGVPVGRIMGVPIIIQPLWFVIVVIFTAGFGPTIRDTVPSLSSQQSYAVALLFVLLLYASVLLHELGHVYVAKRLGMQVRRIVLQFLGGASEIVEEQPGFPGREFLVAIVGPLCSVMLGGIGFAVSPHFDHHTVGWVISNGFGYVNLVVAGFNLLPGWPLDGGRALRSLVWSITRNKLTGTLAAGWVGRVIAVAVAIYALYSQNTFNRDIGQHNNPGFGGLYLLFLAYVLWSNAGIAIAQAKVGRVLPGLDIGAMTRRALAVTAELPVAEAVRRARDAGARALVVVDAYGRPNGVVSESAVTALPVQRQPWVSVSDLARPVEAGLVLSTDMSGERLLQAVQATPATEYLVVEPGGTLRGVLARTDLVAALQAAGLR
jgi:Zn-dependent protease/CBS domain-containing protein